MFFNKKNKILKEFDDYLSRVEVKTDKGWYILYLVEEDWYGRHMKSVDRRLGLVYGKPELGRSIAYFNPRVEKKSEMGKVLVIKS